MGVGEEEDAGFCCFRIGGHGGCVVGVVDVGECRRCWLCWLISVSIWLIAIAIVGWVYAG